MQDHYPYGITLEGASEVHHALVGFELVAESLERQDLNPLEAELGHGRLINQLSDARSIAEFLAQNTIGLTPVEVATVTQDAEHHRIRPSVMEPNYISLVEKARAVEIARQLKEQPFPVDAESCPTLIQGLQIIGDLPFRRRWQRDVSKRQATTMLNAADYRRL